jgi:hypothetical protein
VNKSVIPTQFVRVGYFWLFLADAVLSQVKKKNTPNSMAKTTRKVMQAFL